MLDSCATKSTINITPSTNEKEITLQFDNSKLYIRSKVWGISANHEEIVISLTPFKKGVVYLPNDNYMFYTSTIFYKQQSNDTLLIYALKSSIPQITPKNFSSSIKIIVKEINSNEEFKKYESKNSGLMKFGAY